MKHLRQYIRQILNEQAGLRTLYRGLELSMHPDIADEMRLSVWEETPRGEDEIIRLFKEHLDTQNIGGSWSQNIRVSYTFAGKADRYSDVEGYPGLHVILVAKVPYDVGKDPTTTGEEFIMFADEAEIRLPKGYEFDPYQILIYAPPPQKIIEKYGASEKYSNPWRDLPGAWQIDKITI